ncbi:MAG: hypothetical protein OXG90_09755 [Gammaproteobacteria bacterium]|nr:hypothetical protein [Gammaproteobacteria bacterium]
MSKKRRIHILRPARGLRDGNGQIVDVDERVLRDVAESYDAGKHTAPLVLGHPRHDKPAYGHVGGIERDADGVHAVLGDVSDELLGHYRSRRFTKISASLYRPENPNNPTPGRWHLKHVGFLGAATPVVKGLRPPELGEAPFAGGDGDLAVEIGLADAAPAPALYGYDAMARLMRRMREWIVAEKGVEEADKVAPEHEIEILREAAREPGPAAFSETETDPNAGGPEADPAPDSEGDPEMGEETKTVEELQAELAEAQAENARLAARSDRASVDRDVADLAEATGNVTDAERPVLAAVLLALPAGEDAASADFAEGDAGAKLTPRAGALAVLKNIAGRAQARKAKPPILSESAPADGGEIAGADGAVLDAEAQRRIARIMQTENISFGEALNKALAD